VLITAHLFCRYLNLTEFDDSEECPNCINGHSWYTWTHNKHCCGDHYYDPTADHQCYCQICKKWWFLSCLQPNGIPPNQPDFLIEEDLDDNNDDMSLSLDDEVQCESILGDFHLNNNPQYPIMHGFLGNYDQNNSWLITGSKSQVHALKEWAASGLVPKDWKVILGQDFLRDFLADKNWDFYKCPGCQASI